MLDVGRHIVGSATLGQVILGGRRKGAECGKLEEKASKVPSKPLFQFLPSVPALTHLND